MSLLNFAHLAALLFSMTGMVILDAREKLFFFKSPWRAAVVTVTGVAFFLLWDIAGIVHGIFLHGASDYDTGILLGPEMPVEEVVFLTFLCYLTMNLVGLVERGLGWWAQRKGLAGGSYPREPEDFGGPGLTGGGSHVVGGSSSEDPGTGAAGGPR